MNKIGFTNDTQFNRLGDRSIGDIAINENLGLLISSLEGTRKVVEGKINDVSSGSITLGNTLVQFGRFNGGSPSFRITFPTEFGAGGVFAFIQEAGNDAPTANQAQIDGNNLPNATGIDVIVNESGSGSDIYYYLAIGAAP